MIDTVEVFLWGRRIGIIHQNGTNGVPEFEYDPGFRGSGIELAPFKMPLSDRVFSFPELRESSAFRGLPGLVADTLPDRFGNSVINVWLRQNGREAESMDPLERLCYTGTRGMGALEFFPAEGPDAADSNVDVTGLTELASRILSEKERIVYDAEDLTVAQMLKIGSSAGGARAKAVIAWNERSGEVRSGQARLPTDFDHWLIKFDNVRGNGDHGESDRRQYTLIEYAYHLMAKDCGIEMSECRILKKDGMSHFMTKRFDRRGGEKIFVQTLGALGHFDFNVPRTCGYETYAEMAKRLGIGRNGIGGIYRRAVFNVLSANCDDHVKNISFTMDRQGDWGLSPAYDLTFAYNPDNYWLREHQMTIGGKSSNISEDDLLAFGKRIGLNVRFCRDTLTAVRRVIRDWKRYADQCGIDAGTAAAIDAVLNGKITRSV